MDTLKKRVADTIGVDSELPTDYIKEKMSDYIKDLQDSFVEDHDALKRVTYKLEKTQALLSRVKRIRKSRKIRVTILVICMLSIMFAEQMKFYQLFSNLQYFEQDYSLRFYSCLMSIIIFAVTFYVSSNRNWKEYAAIYSSSILLFLTEVSHAYNRYGADHNKEFFVINLLVGFVLAFFIPNTFSWLTRKLKDLI